MVWAHLVRNVLVQTQTTSNFQPCWNILSTSVIIDLYQPKDNMKHGFVYHKIICSMYGLPEAVGWLCNYYIEVNRNPGLFKHLTQTVWFILPGIRYWWSLRIRTQCHRTQCVRRTRTDAAQTANTILMLAVRRPIVALKINTALPWDTILCLRRRCTLPP